MGEPYGELLRRKAAQGVKVRLLVWYSPRGSARQNSLVGYVNPAEYWVGGVINRTSDETLAMASGMSGGMGGYAMAPSPRPASSVAEQRLDYCTRWWRQATAGQIEHLEVRCRDGVPAKVKASVASEADPPQASAGTHGALVTEKMLIEDNATHHQKPILIDYSHEQGSHAVGYVMGLNSVSDYWDSVRHDFEDPLRERDWAGQSDAVAGLALKKLGRPVSRKPLGLSGEMGARAMFETTKRHSRVIEGNAWPSEADWLERLMALAARSEQALQASFASGNASP